MRTNRFDSVKAKAWAVMGIAVAVLLTGGTLALTRQADRQAEVVTAPGPTTSGTTKRSVDSQTARCVGAENAPGSADPWGGCWPGPQNTGYPHGLPGDGRAPVKLTPYTGSLSIGSCGVVIDSKVVEGSLTITAGNGSHSADAPCVTITNSLIRGSVHTDTPEQGPVVITDTEIAPPDMDTWSNAGDHNVFLKRVNSHGSGATVKCGSYCAVHDTWIHGMKLAGSFHYNAIGSNGLAPDGFFTIEHVYADCGDFDEVSPTASEEAGCSRDIGFYGDFGPVRNIRLDKSYLSAADTTQPGQPGYCLDMGYGRGKPHSLITAGSNAVTNNVFGRGQTGRCGLFGPTTNWCVSCRQDVWRNNRYDDGEIIPEAS